MLSFNFSKLTQKHAEKEFPLVDEVETLASIGVPSVDVLDRYLLDQEEPFNRHKKEALEQEIFQQPPITRLNILPRDLGERPTPKEEHSFD